MAGCNPKSMQEPPMHVQSDVERYQAVIAHCALLCFHSLVGCTASASSCVAYKLQQLRIGALHATLGGT